jgi:uroporphyrinogen decarboxylase
MTNDVFLRALRREPTEYTPIWLMRQAGRYLPEYQATRQRAGSFLGLCKNPELACEVTLQPLARWPLDAAILFSDILTVPDAMGLELFFIEGEGPRFAQPLRTEAAIRQLAVPDVATELRYVMDAVRTIRAALQDRVPLIGFAGSPWTLACYMVEGQGSSDFRQVKTMLYRRPDLMQHILQQTAHAVRDYLNAQIAAGAQAVMLFDTWGGILPSALYQEYSLVWMRQVLDGLTRTRTEVAPNGGTVTVSVPRIVFTKGGGLWLDAIADSGAEAVGLDWTVDLGAARRQVGARVALQGNLDPMVLLAGADATRQHAIATLDAYGVPRSGEGHIFNLGHGISQFTAPENVSVLVETVHQHSRRQRTALAANGALSA